MKKMAILFDLGPESKVYVVPYENIDDAYNGRVRGSDRVCGLAEDDLHVNRQRSENMLLRNTEERKVAVQTHWQNTR